MSGTSRISRLRVANKTIDVGDVERERMIQLYRSKAGHAANVSSRYRQFVDAVDQCCPLEKLSGLLSELVASFGAFGVASKKYNDVVAVVDPSILRESEMQYLETKELVDRAQQMFDNHSRNSEKTSEIDRDIISQPDPFEDKDLQVTPDDSVSHISHSTTASSTRAKAAARKAAMEARLRFRVKQEELENKLFEEEISLKRLHRESQLKRERLKLESDLYAAEVEENVLSSFLDCGETQIKDRLIHVPVQTGGDSIVKLEDDVASRHVSFHDQAATYSTAKRNLPGSSLNSVAVQASGDSCGDRQLGMSDDVALIPVFSQGPAEESTPREILFRRSSANLVGREWSHLVGREGLT